MCSFLDFCPPACSRLQFPIVMNYSALNYGSLGMVVGHEITHGFDKHGTNELDIE